MTKKDQDIAKLKEYALELGIPIRVLKYTRNSGCLAYYAQGSHIVIFKASNTSKTDIIMSILHELGHHLDWSKNKAKNPERDKAYYALTGVKPLKVKSQEEIKKYTKLILDSEKVGISYMTEIAEHLNLSIPLDRIKKQQKIDIFHYEYLHKYNKFPPGKIVLEYERSVLNGK